MKEVVIISGKGGTGKTSVAAAFAALAQGRAVMADCDVDAADLHLILKPTVQHSHEFRSGHQATIRPQDCVGCGQCLSLCRFGAIHKVDNGGAATSSYRVDGVACEGCGVCVRFCPANAIDFPEEVCGQWFVSATRFGPLVHARLGVASENSGKLVTMVRSAAKELATTQGYELVLIDGSPGIGCPVIASLTAAQGALIVTEPTVSGIHDLRRIAQLCRRLATPAMVCVNKWDINPQVTLQIESDAASLGLTVVGRVRYDKSVTMAQRAQQAIPEFGSGGLSEDLTLLWQRVCSTVGLKEHNG
jgi:MinD superfamily P-loop ATPase